MTGYTKQDAKMTQGLAIVCMVVLHLFCRKGSDVLGTPLLWVNDSTPLVYWFGFFAEICVALYAMCAGYAQQFLYQSEKTAFSDRLKRIGRLMVNYWIVLVLFSVVGLFADKSGSIPGSFWTFLQNALLLKSYNGAWWFLHTYVLLQLIPPAVLLFPIRKTGMVAGVCICGVWSISLFSAGKLGLLDIPDIHPVVTYLLTELKNLAGVMTSFWLGAWLCRHRVIDRIRTVWDEHVRFRFRQGLLLAAALLIFAGVNIVHKAVLMGPVALVTFVLFNLWQKSKISRTIWLFLGNHSTNIWLVHMFFYAYIFTGWIAYVKYPLFIFGVMMALCIATSYVIKGIQQGCNKIGMALNRRKVD